MPKADHTDSNICINIIIFRPLYFRWNLIDVTSSQSSQSSQMLFRQMKTSFYKKKNNIFLFNRQVYINIF